MHKMMKLFLIFMLTSKTIFAQEVWKERSDFYTVFKAVFESAKEGNTEQLLSNLPEMDKKFDAFYKSIDDKFQGKDKEIKINQTLLSEKMTFINLIVKKNMYNIEILLGELTGMFNLYHKILLKGEDPNTTKEILKFYKKEEKKYDERKKIIAKENNWRLFSK